MGRTKRKGRSVRKNHNVSSEPEEFVQAPHSFVIHRGLPGEYITELTKDFRKVMEPFTASSLKERKKNTIKDFVAIAGYLHVSHLSIFSKTTLGMYLKLSRLPRGPTLSFKVHDFCLARDVVSSLKKQYVVDQAFKHSPLIILNGFSGEGLQMKMMTTMFQNLFPTINLRNVDLNTVRRCVLLSYNKDTKLIDFRHYCIKVVPVGISKGVKKVVQGKVPNLSRFNDISEFLTKGGLLSESEAEDDPSHQVQVPQKLVTRGNMEAGKSSIRLSELGPRLSLQLIKIEDGLLGGEVLYHDFIQKTEEEKQEIEKLREQKKKLKEKRKKIQEQNKQTKEEKKQQLKEKSLKGMEKSKTKNDLEVVSHQTEREAGPLEEDDDDEEHYRQEVGENPDKDLHLSKRGQKRPRSTPDFIKNKRMKMNSNNIKKQQTRDPKNKNSASKRGKKFAKRNTKSDLDSRDHRPIGGKFFKKATKHRGKSR